MFNITDNERLRDAYALLMFMQSDVPASSEKKAAVKNLAATVKMEIREFNRRPASDSHIIEERGSNGYIEGRRHSARRDFSCPAARYFSVRQGNYSLHEP